MCRDIKGQFISSNKTMDTHTEFVQSATHLAGLSSGLASSGLGVSFASVCTGVGAGAGAGVGVWVGAGAGAAAAAGSVGAGCVLVLSAGLAGGAAFG